jgi:hypothetical protein
MPHAALQMNKQNVTIIIFGKNKAITFAYIFNNKPNPVIVIVL